MESKGRRKKRICQSLRRKGAIHYDRCEPRQMLVGDFIGPVVYSPSGIEDVFAPRAVTYEQMETRAKYHRYAPNEVIVAVTVPSAKAAAAAAAQSIPWNQWTGHGEARLRRVMQVVERGEHSVVLAHVDLGVGASVLAALRFVNDRPGVLWSSPNFIYSGPDPRDYIPNDPLYGNQYHHNNMNNPSAWDVSLGNPTIVIGVTDDGVLLTHPDLQPNIWVNPGEIPGNGIDDDNNGYIDDVNGWDFSSGNNNPNPNGGSNDHGTHVAGIAAARTNNAIGIAGVAGRATIMPLQFYAGTSSWTAAIINETYTYAANNGARIVTTSYNVDGWVGDPVFTAGLQYMYDKGVLHFNSAGNNNQLNPPRQAFEQSLFVSSLDQNNVKSSFSNYGTGIDIAGHGSNIYSTVLNNNYGSKSGTSMSTPNVAGAAALLWGVYPHWNRYQVAAHLLATTTNIDAQNPNYIGLLGAGMVNTGAALHTASIPAPKVKSLTGLPAAGSTSSNFNVTGFTVAFDQVMNPATVNSAANIVMRERGRDGVFGTADDWNVPLVANKTYRVGTNNLSFTFAGGPLGPGHYRLSLIAGGLANPFGTPLDGNGDGSGGDSLHYAFNIVPQTLQALPSGSQIYEQQFSATIPAANQKFDYFIDLDAGQTLAAGVQGNGALVPTIEIRDHNNQIVASVTGTGSRAATNPVPTLASGRYTVRIGNAAGSAGTFQAHIMINAALELANFGGAANGSLSAAENIESSVIGVGSQSDRLAVRGNLASGGFSENFESGSLGSQWTTSVSNAAGRIRVTGQHGTAAGNYALLMDVSSNNVYSRNEATWLVNLAGTTTATLSFYHASWNDEVNTMPASFTNNSDSDGVAISANGVNWHRVYTPSGSMPVGQWQQQTVDLAAAAASAGISLGNNFRIRFQQYDNYPIDTDGRGYDQIAITLGSAAPADWYRFSLADGEIASLAATAASGGLSLELYNAGGTLLATGSAKSNISSFIDRFQDSTSNQARDTYYVRVLGGSGDYSLVVTRNGQFDAETNDAQATAQNVNNVSGIVGFASTTSDYYRFHLVNGQTIAWDAVLPGQGPYLIQNGLDQSSGSQLRMQLIAPGGAVVASGTSSVEHTATATGDYFLRVWANAGSGEYAISRRPNQISLHAETGLVTALADVVVTVHLTRTYVDPIVILSPPSALDAEPLIANVVGVSSNSFQLRLSSWNPMADPAFEETVRYLVVERGTTDLGGGKKLIADRAIVFDTFTPVTFSSAFSATPAVVATPLRESQSNPKAIRLQNVTPSGMMARTQFSELMTGVEDDVATVYYIAVDPGRYGLNQWVLEAGITPHAVTHVPYVINYQQPLPAVPFLGAQIMTYHDADPAAIRQISGTATSATIFIQEETSLDPEVNHGPEVVGFVALAPTSSFQSPQALGDGGQGGESNRLAAASFAPLGGPARHVTRGFSSSDVDRAARQVAESEAVALPRADRNGHVTTRARPRAAGDVSPMRGGWITRAATMKASDFDIDGSVDASIAQWDD